MGTWHNDDGLYQKFGRTEGTVHTAGQYPTAADGRNQVVNFTLTLTDLGTASAIIDDVVMIPKGARIERVEIVTKTAATGTNAVLNFGLVREDRSTALDADGLIAALAVTAFADVGVKNILYEGTTGNGALIGTTLAYAGRPCADYDTAAFTAGVLEISVFYNMIT